MNTHPNNTRIMNPLRLHKKPNRRISLTTPRIHRLSHSNHQHTRTMRTRPNTNQLQAGANRPRAPRPSRTSTRRQNRHHHIAIKRQIRRILINNSRFHMPPITVPSNRLHIRTRILTPKNTRATSATNIDRPRRSRSTTIRLAKTSRLPGSLVSKSRQRSVNQRVPTRSLRVDTTRDNYLSLSRRLIKAKLKVKSLPNNSLIRNHRNRYTRASDLLQYT